MTTSPVPSVQDQPTVRLTSWRIFDVHGGAIPARFVIGREWPGRSWRTSTPIEHFDRDAMTITTRSGRRCQLVGEPIDGDDVQLGCAFAEAWRPELDQITVVDVTGEYWTPRQCDER